MKKYISFILKLILIFTSALVAQNNIKWEETFDNSVPSVDWKTIDSDGSGSGYELVDVDQTQDGTLLAPQAGGYFWVSDLNNCNLAGEIDEWLISPRISVIYEGDSLFFWAGAIGAAFDDSIKVKVSTTNNFLSSFIYNLGHFKVDGPAGSWNRYGFDLSQFDSADIYFAINYYVKDGGPGGANSDHIWIDHPFITGDPSTINSPPSLTYLRLPANESNLDPESQEINFVWSASEDADDSELEYTLSIINVFPKMYYEGLTDTVYSLDWQNILNKNTTYKWTIEVTDGKSYVASVDTFSFSLGIPTAIAENDFEIPNEFALMQNYPNPFNPVTTIKYSLSKYLNSNTPGGPPVSREVTLIIYDILGKEVITLVEEIQQPGNYEVQLNASELTSGIYFYRLSAGKYVETKKMVLMK